jgi:hypothetical protein
MIELQIWWWLAAGLIPYRIRRQHLRGGVCTLQIYALFWAIEVRQRSSGRHDWTLHVPLVTRLRDAIWAAVSRLRH